VPVINPTIPTGHKASRNACKPVFLISMKLFTLIVVSFFMVSSSKGFSCSSFHELRAATQRSSLAAIAARLPTVFAV
jgi:hypothetical protein